MSKYWMDNHKSQKSSLTILTGEKLYINENSRKINKLNIIGRITLTYR